LRVVASLACHLIVMRHGKVVEEGAASELFKRPKTDTPARCSPPRSGWRPNRGAR
jgi:ABC-type microcin C transport system duplicated ATPase subunit YejF